MKLTDLAKQVLREDTWGNNPSAAGAMSPGRSPTTTQPPAPATNARMENLKSRFGIFVADLEKQEDSAKHKLKTDLSQKLGGKNVTAHCSKGSVGQVEQDYTIDLVDVDVVKLKDEFHIVLKGADKSDYYVDIEHQVKVNGPANKAKATARTGSNIVHQPVIGMAAPGANTGKAGSY